MVWAAWIGRILEYILERDINCGQRNLFPRFLNSTLEVDMENEGMLPLRQLVEAVTAETMWRQEERLRALEARVDSLEGAIQRALETVFPRVDALVSQLEKQYSCLSRGCPTSTDSGLSDQMARVSISTVRSADHSRSAPVQSASCSSSSFPQNTHSPALDSRPFPTCATARPPVSTSSSSVTCVDHASGRSSSAVVQVSRDTPRSSSGALFTSTSTSVPFPTTSVLNSGFPSLPQNPASTISTTADDTSTRFSFSTASIVSQPSCNSSFNRIVCSPRSPLYSRVVSTDQPVSSASFLMTTTASLPSNTSTSWTCFNSPPSQDNFSGGFMFSTNSSSTFTNVSLPSITSSCIASDNFSSIGSGESYQLASALDVPSAGSFQTDVQIYPSNVLPTPALSSFTSSSPQLSTGTPIASPHSAMAPFVSPSLPSAVHANSSPSDTIAHSYSDAVDGHYPSNPASSNPSVFGVPNVFGLSCVPSAWWHSSS